MSSKTKELPEVGINKKLEVVKQDMAQLLFSRELVQVAFRSPTVSSN